VEGVANKTHPWEAAWRSGRWREVRPPMLAVEEFAKTMKKAGARRVLDLGSGGGRHTLMLAREGFQVVGLDVSDTALSLLDRKVREAGLSNVALVRHEMSRLPFVDGYFDAVVSANVVHHGLAREARRAMAEARRVLRKGGLGYFVVVSDKDYRVGSGRKLEARTFVFTEGDEKGIVHHFFSVPEFRRCLEGFKVLSLMEQFDPEEGGNMSHIYAAVRKE
jgi:ubiquinone/menaquinone biosynthesis C-methylase UbiE